MSDSLSITRLLQAVDRGESQAADELLPLVYDELRRIAAARLAGEAADHTLQPTALVHEAWLKLVKSDDRASAGLWNGRRHFLGAAATAMRQILIDSARRRRREKRGGDREQYSLESGMLPADVPSNDIEALGEALRRLEQVDPPAAELVNLRYFGGLTLGEVAETLKISPRSADRLWAFARAWLLAELQDH